MDRNEALEIFEDFVRLGAGSIEDCPWHTCEVCYTLFPKLRRFSKYTSLEDMYSCYCMCWYIEANSGYIKFEKAVAKAYNYINGEWS